MELLCWTFRKKIFEYDSHQRLIISFCVIITLTMHEGKIFIWEIIAMCEMWFLWCENSVCAEKLRIFGWKENDVRWLKYYSVRDELSFFLSWLISIKWLANWKCFRFLEAISSIKDFFFLFNFILAKNHFNTCTCHLWDTYLFIFFLSLN